MIFGHQHLDVVEMSLLREFTAVFVCSFNIDGSSFICSWATELIPPGETSVLLPPVLLPRDIILKLQEKARWLIALAHNQQCVKIYSHCPIPHSEGKLRAGISNTDFSADNSPPEHDANDVEKTDQSPSGKEKSNLQAAGTMAALIAAGAVGAIALTLASGGPRALIAAVAKSGCFAAFALIFVSEIGDKTFFIAALLAMRQSKSLVLLGSSAALALMTVISVIIGRLFQKIPAQLQTALPLGEYAAITLLIIFGIRAIKNAWDLPPTAGENSSSESGELKEAEEFVGKVAEKRLSSPFEVLSESFSLVFVAEWGDRSMLATVALAAAQSPWGVATGAIIGHVLATSLAVVGGAFLAQYISEKLVGYTGGVLFLAFAVATMMGAF